MDITALVLLGFITLLSGLVLLLIGLRSTRTDELNRRLQDYVVEPAFTRQAWPDETELRRPEVSGTFASRTIAPMFRFVGGIFGRITPSRAVQDLDTQLVRAGRPFGLGAREFYGIRILFLLLGGLIGYLIITNGDRGILTLILAAVATYMTFYLPKWWLRSRIRRNKDRIRRDLPDALDMLSVSADAGLGFDQSLQRISENWDTPLSREFGRVVSEMNMGVSRTQALRNMAERVDIPELSSFVAVIIQSDELGMSIADTLHSQANQMRIERRYWAQEQARKIPLKMLFPLMLLILPAMFAVVLGPAIPAIMDSLGGAF